MSWWLRLEDRERRRFLEAFARLPIAAEVETERGGVGLVHADVPHGMAWKEFLRRIAAGDRRVIAYALWSRRRLEMNNTTGVKGIGRVFVGHSIVETIQNLGNVYYVDSGAFLAPLAGENRGPTVSLMIAKTASLIGASFDDRDILQSSTNLPFGHYTSLTA